MDGKGRYTWHDCQVDICIYKGGVAVGEGRLFESSLPEYTEEKEKESEHGGGGIPPRPPSTRLVGGNREGGVPSVQDIIRSMTGRTTVLQGGKNGGDGMRECSCGTTDKEVLMQMEFFLPAIVGPCCTCGGVISGGHSSATLMAVLPSPDNSYPLRSFLRPWQAGFFSSMGITTADQLVRASDRNAENVAIAMDLWRDMKNLEPQGLGASAIALR